MFSDTASVIWSVIWSQVGTNGGGTETALMLDDPKSDEYVWGNGRVKIKNDYTFFGGLREVRVHHLQVHHLTTVVALIGDNSWQFKQLVY